MWTGPSKTRPGSMDFWTNSRLDSLLRTKTSAEVKLEALSPLFRYWLIFLFFVFFPHGITIIDEQ